jgi:transcriptional regulator GlxA family with amidase domain
MDRRVSKVVELLDNSPVEPLHLVDLARAAGLSPSHLGHLFKAATGTSPAAYKRAVCLKHSAEMLVLSTRSVKEIAFAHGFRSVSHFVRDFKQAYGAAPRQYRTAVWKS